MTEFNPGDEVRVHEPQSQGGRWVFPGERLFVQEVNVRGHRAFVRCPAAYTAVWVDFENLMPPSPAVDMRALVDRVGHLERRLAKLEDVKNQGDELDTPEVVSCDCPHSDDDVHERGCVNHPTQKAAEPVDDRQSLQPAAGHHRGCEVPGMQRAEKAPPPRRTAHLPQDRPPR